MDTYSNGDQPSADTKNNTQKAASKAPSCSFCIPSATVDALIDGKATAAEIVCCLSLAAFTDATGVFSTASTNSVFQRTRFGWNKTKKAFNRLCERQALGRPLLVTRERYIAETGLTPVDGPVSRAKVTFAFETYGQPVEERVWFGKGLVEGFEDFEKPLMAITDAGDVAARLLLLLYRMHDLEEWIAVPPSSGLHFQFVPTVMPAPLGRGYHLIRYKKGGCYSRQTLIDRVTDPLRQASVRRADFQTALNALLELGLVYEAIFVINRAPPKAKGLTPETDVYHVPMDAQPMYVLATQNRFGYKVLGEEGISGRTARLAGALCLPVSGMAGALNGTFAAISPPGLALGITGAYRLRFRVANGKNAFVKDAWSRLHNAEREALAHLEAVRGLRGLEPTAASRVRP